jgi:hypothetical protein
MACSDIQPYQKRDALGYYKLLNLTPDATAAEIRKSFYAFAKVYHPDKNTSPEAEVVVSNAKMKRSIATYSFTVQRRPSSLRSPW